jgi:hypothetical protein
LACIGWTRGGRQPPPPQCHYFDEVNNAIRTTPGTRPPTCTLLLMFSNTGVSTSNVSMSSRPVTKEDSSVLAPTLLLMAAAGGGGDGAGKESLGQLRAEIKQKLAERKVASTAGYGQQLPNHCNDCAGHQQWWDSRWPYQGEKQQALVGIREGGGSTCAHRTQHAVSPARKKVCEARPSFAKKQKKNSPKGSPKKEGTQARVRRSRCCCTRSEGRP